MLVECDNMAVVSVINSLSCKDRMLAHLLRCLHFYTAHFDINLRAIHIPGAINIVADATSRNNLQVMYHYLSGADSEPVRIPPPLQELVISQRPDWLSPGWQKLLNSSLLTVWHRVPEKLIGQPKTSTWHFADH